jgi:phenylalanyl-tRNA synthetase beta chain
MPCSSSANRCMPLTTMCWWSEPAGPPQRSLPGRRPGESLTTLDGIERPLDEFTVLVCDTAGPLSIAGVMGGAESEVGPQTRSILLEGAAWNFINVRRTLSAQRMASEAAYRFSRGVHPAMAERGVRRGLQLMQAWTGGVVSKGLVDNYPLPPQDPTVEITPGDVERWLGIHLPAGQIAEILRSLEFSVEVEGEAIRATAPDHRLDIGEGVIGTADLMEEIARIYGYDRIPETRLADELPPQRGNPALEREERLRDLLVNLGLQEVITYRVVLPEQEARRLPAPELEGPPDGRPYLRLVNPIASDRVALRHSLLASVLEIAERNARLQERLALFEIGPVFFQSEEGMLPDEPQRLAIVLAGSRGSTGWQPGETGQLDFYDLKGILEACLEGLNLEEARFEPAEYPSFHPGKCARIYLDDREVGVMGEIHPLVREKYELPHVPVLAAELDAEAILERVPERYSIQPVPAYPPVLEDLAVVVPDSVPAARVAGVIRQAGGELLAAIRLFDVYRGDQAGPGQKSLAYSLTYQAPDRTLTDQEVAQLRQRIINRLEQEFAARLRR